MTALLHLITILSNKYIIIQLCILLVLFSVCFIMLIMGFIILLDGFYRRNEPKIIFNWVLDYILPLITLLSPLVLLFTFSPSVSFFTRFTLTLLLHGLLTIPLLSYWPYIRRWSCTTENASNLWSWKHPRMFKQIAIALVYPFFFCVYLCSTRYFRLGSSVNVSEWYSDIIWLMFFALPYTLCWFFLFLSVLKAIHNFFWIPLSALLYSFHLYALTFELYFKSFECLYKLLYLVNCYLSLNGPVNFMTKTVPPFDVIFYPKWRYWLHFVYYRPYIVRIIIFSCILLEFFFFNFTLHYSLYILFVYPIVNTVLTSLFSFYHTDWVLTCCFSDYLNLKWKTPHYPAEFWVFCESPLYWFNFEWTFDEKTQNSIENAYAIKKKTVIKNGAGSPYVTKLKNRVSTRRFGIKVAASFRASTGIRFIHTSASRPQFHALTGLFARNWSDLAV